MNRDLVGSLVFLALGAAGLHGALDLPFGSASVPGPAMQPAALSILIMGLALVNGARALGRRGAAAASSDAPRDDGGYQRVALAVVCLALYVAVMGLIGFPLATFLCMWALYALAAEHPFSWRPPLASAVLTAVTVILFSVLLEVRTPAGTLWN
jgi:hypothetical protein